MKKLAFALLATLLAMPALAQDQHQSYVTYDDGDTILLQGDGREINARVNLPVYPGDELRAGRRGRTEVRLSDGNVIALDQQSAVRIESALASFEREDTQTVATLLGGQVVVYRLYRGSEPLRLDTANASYLSSKEALYSVERASTGIDFVTVFQGSVEVRTPQGAKRLDAGVRAKVDLTGVYSTTRLVSDGATEFEQWFIRRASRYSANESRYLDSSLAYVESDLNDHGRWVYVSEYSGHVWRPYVSVGWRPYYNGYWHTGWGGSMVWVSYEPWGWAPYHYGRWAYHSYHGWVWLPGYGYSPAWVYWVWGPSWVGWAPAGWYDCYWGYRSWYYYPNYCNNCGYYRGYGFQGRVTISSRDLNAYTVVDRKGLFSTRVDRASLTADEVKTRLARDGNKGVLSNQSVRVSKDEIRDPSRVAERIIRDSNGSGTGTSQGAGSPADVTQFFQRDPNPSASVRDRVTRGLPRDTQTTPTTATRGTTGTTAPSDNTGKSEPGVVTRGTVSGGSTGGTVTRGGTSGTVTRTTPSAGSGSTPTTGTRTAPTTGTRTTPSTGSGSTPTTGTRSTPATGTRSDGETPSGGTGVVRPRTDSPAPTPDTRSNQGGSETRSRPVARPEPAKPTETRQAPAKDPDPEPRAQTRSRPATPEASQPVSRAPARSSSPQASDDWRRGNAGSTDPAQRVITTIGGARITPSGSDRSDSGSTTRATPSTRSGDSSPDSWRSRGSFTTGRGDSGESTTGSAPRQAPSSRPSGITRPAGSGSSSRPSSGGTTATRPSPDSSGGSSTSTRSSGSSSSGSGRAGMTRPSSSGGSGSSASRSSSSSSSSSSGSRSGGSSSSGNSSSGSSGGKVSRPN
jgi:hypothetical protein